jgi:uncharacterized zinc-type alcohol dehydrogenase-like protein
MTRKTIGYALLEPGGDLQPWTFERRALRPDDVEVRVTFCGVCHTDLHAIEAAQLRVAQPDDGPLVPGHEFVGEVTAVGPDVTGFAVGDAVAVGNIVDSCGVCEACLDSAEPYCEQFPTLTYGGVDRRDGTPQYGGYSTSYVVTEKFVYHLPAGLDPAGAAPLMCAGVTVFEPLRQYGVGPGSVVGVVGLGGLGHLAVKLAKALGAQVAVFTTSDAKAGPALELGADEAVLSPDAEQMGAQRGRFDLIVDTASGKHDPSPYLRALRRGGTLVMLGLPERYEPEAMALLGRNLTVSGSGGTDRTREMLAFCAEHGIVADVEVLPIAEVGTALARLGRNDVRWRFVLDVAASTS